MSEFKRLEKSLDLSPLLLLLALLALAAEGWLANPVPQKSRTAPGGWFHWLPAAIKRRVFREKAGGI